MAARVAEVVADVGAGLWFQGRQIGEVTGERLAGVDERRADRQRLVERDDGGEPRVIDLDQLQRLDGGRFIDRDHGRDRIPLVPSDVDGEDRPVAERGPEVGIAPREVGAGDHRQHARVRAGARGIHPRDACVRVGRSQDRRVAHARRHEVGHVAGTARDLLLSVDPRHRASDDA